MPLWSWAIHQDVCQIKSDGPYVKSYEEAGRGEVLILFSMAIMLMCKSIVKMNVTVTSSMLKCSTEHRYTSMLPDKEEIRAMHLKGHYFWITNRPTWGREPEREHQRGKIQAEKKRWRERKSDGLSSLGQPATVKAVIYSAIISVDIWSESQPSLSHHIHTEWPTRIGRAWFIIQLFITLGGRQREKNT